MNILIYIFFDNFFLKCILIIKLSVFFKMNIVAIIEIPFSQYNLLSMRSMVVLIACLR